MPSSFIFDCLQLKLSFCGISFPKSIVNGDLVLDKLRQRYKSFFPSQYSESLTKICCGAFPLGIEVLKTFELLASMYITNWKLFVETKSSRKT